MKMMSRHMVAKELGRRVSRGEFERMFSRVYPIKLNSVCSRWVLDTDGKKVKRTWHPVVALMHPDSPKSKRKHGRFWHKIVRGKRARFNHAV